jgi:hypothetical protein
MSGVATYRPESFGERPQTSGAISFKRAGCEFES